MRSKMTVAFLGLWEQLHNPDFNMVEFDQFKNEAGMTHQQWQAANPTLKGNQLICISNMENINAVMINENAPQKREAFLREAAQRARRASARAQRSGLKGRDTSRHLSRDKIHARDTEQNYRGKKCARHKRKPPGQTLALDEGLAHHH